mgnify:CR=1 FL=1
MVSQRIQTRGLHIVALVFPLLLSLALGGSSPLLAQAAQAAPHAPPAKPQLLSPADHTTLYDTTDIWLDWSDVPNATNYTAEVRLQNDQVALCDHVGESRCHVGQLVIANGFRWHVEAFNAEGGSGQTEDWHFDVVIGPTPSASVFLPLVSR